MSESNRWDCAIHFNDYPCRDCEEHKYRFEEEEIQQSDEEYNV